jgi:serine/threonine protein kinase
MPIRSITKTPRGRLEVCDIAYIASALLGAIGYLYITLGIAHGDISIEIIMVNLKGQVKLSKKDLISY